MTVSRLPEVAEAAATGSVAETYADIRLVLGLPLVNLVYRHLAATPGLLEETWAQLRPNLRSTAAEEAARQLAPAALPGVVPIPRSALAAAGLSAEEATLALATLDAYARANARNLLAVHALLDGCSGDRRLRSGAARAPAPAGPILPMADLDALAPAAAAVLDEMSLAVTGLEEPRLVPSLLRHFARSPCLLALLWTVLRPALEDEDTAAPAAELAGHARALAARLPHPVRPLAEGETKQVLLRFAVAMPQILVIGELLRTALAEALPRDDG